MSPTAGPLPAETGGRRPSVPTEDRFDSTSSSLVDAPEQSMQQRGRNRRDHREGSTLSASAAIVADEMSWLLDDDSPGGSAAPSAARSFSAGYNATSSSNDAPGGNSSPPAARSFSAGYNATSSSRNSISSMWRSASALSLRSEQSREKPSAPPPDMFATVVEASAEHIVGLYAIEVWWLDEFDRLISIPVTSTPADEETPDKTSTLYVRRITQEADPDSEHFNPSAKDAYERLTEPSRLDYLPKHSTMPGVGLAGVLWVQASQNVSRRAAPARQTGAPMPRRRQSVFQRRQTGSPMPRRRQSVFQRRRSVAQRRHSVAFVAHHPNPVEEEEEEVVDDSLLWRNVGDLANDPDQPYDERLHYFAKAGFVLATGVPFGEKTGCKGMVVFFANPHAHQLEHPNNVNLIKCATQCIGSALAMKLTIEKAKETKKRQSLANWRTIRAKVTAAVRFREPLIRSQNGTELNGDGNGGGPNPPFFRLSSLVDSMQQNELRQVAVTTLENAQAFLENSCVDIWFLLKSKSMKWISKVQGSNVGVPPPFSTKQVMWSLLGSLIAHSLLGCLHYSLRKHASHIFDGSALVIGPIGALTTLQYNLTAAPASQPRNSILAQLVGIVTAFCLHQIDMSIHARTALAPVIVIAATAWSGIIHPPAGAAAVAFAAKENLKAAAIIVFLCEVSITIVIAVIINNLSAKRQYPTNWPMLKATYAFLRPYLVLLGYYWSLLSKRLQAFMPFCPKKEQNMTPRDAFRMIDENDAGFLQKDELARVIETLAVHGDLNLGGKPPLELAEAMIQQVNSDADGRIGVRDFESEIILYSALTKRKEAARNAFAVIDQNGDGVLDKFEVSGAIELLVEQGQMNLDGKSSLEVAEAWIGEADADGNGKLDVEEFAEMMKEFA